MDIHSLLSTVGILVSVFLAGANAMIFCVVKFNDLKHMSEDLSDIKDMIKCEASERKQEQSKIWDRLDSTTERIAKVEGRLKEKK